MNDDDKAARLRAWEAKNERLRLEAAAKRAQAEAEVDAWLAAKPPSTEPAVPWSDPVWAKHEAMILAAEERMLAGMLDEEDDEPEAAPAAPVRPYPAVPPVYQAPAPTAASSIDETAIAMGPIDLDPLPFRPDPHAAPPAPLPAGGERSGETAFLPPIEGLDDPLPFQQPAAEPELTVEQYASLCVERTLYPGQDARVAERYRVLTMEALQRLDSQWRDRFALEGELYRRWQAAYAQYQAWLRSRGSA